MPKTPCEDIMPDNQDKSSSDSKSDKIKAPRYLQILEFVAGDPNLTCLLEICIYSYVYGYYVEGKAIKVSNRYLANLFRCGISTIQEKIANLVRKGYIQRVELSKTERELIPLKIGRGKVTQTDENVDNLGDDPSKNEDTRPDSGPPHLDSGCPRPESGYNNNSYIDLNKSINRSSTYSEEEKKIHNLVSEVLQDSTYTIKHTKNLMKKHIQHRSLTIFESIHCSVQSFVDFLASGAIVNNKTKYFLGVIKKDRFFGDKKKYTIDEKVSEDKKRANAPLDASHAPYNIDRTNATAPIINPCLGKGKGALQDFLNSLSMPTKGVGS